MEAHLQSLKVPELKALLQGASLPVSGNKADLIKRLLENPEVTASVAGTEEQQQPAAAVSDAADGELIQADAAPASAAPAATSNGKPAASSATTTAPPTSTDAASALPAAAAATTTSVTTGTEATEAAAAPSPDQPSVEETRKQLIAELEKRKARAARFGQELGEAERKLERAIKFGADGSGSMDHDSLALLSRELGVGAKGRGGGGQAKETKGRNAASGAAPTTAATGRSTPPVPIKEPVKPMTEEEKGGVGEAKARRGGSA